MKVDTDYYDEGPSPFNITWSPDSHWLAYNRILPSHLHAIFVYSLEAKKNTQITDGMSDALYPAFDRSGKYLYFAASTDFGLTAGDSDMSGIARPVTYSVYAAVLRTDLPSPVAPQSDDENAEKDSKSGDQPAAPVKTDDTKHVAESGSSATNGNGRGIQ